ncbi:MAG: DUF2513 domain-containing protein [Oscillospiraceae bacterium]|nr:DUF2513 domain-containing protein [Oscillospiraceae bacterium]
MKLNPDCIRAILLCLEENQGMVSERVQHIMLHCMPDLGFSQEDMIYSTIKMIERGLIEGKARYSFGGAAYEIADITLAGHEFLANIHNEQNWNKTKEVAAKVGAPRSLSILTAAAEGVTKGILKTVLDMGNY